MTTPSQPKINTKLLAEQILKASGYAPESQHLKPQAKKKLFEKMRDFLYHLRLACKALR